MWSEVKTCFFTFTFWLHGKCHNTDVVKISNGENPDSEVLRSYILLRTNGTALGGAVLTFDAPEVKTEVGPQRSPGLAWQNYSSAIFAESVLREVLRTTMRY